MVPDKHRRPSPQKLLPLDDKLDPNHQPHQPFEAPTGRPLTHLAVAHQTQHDRGQHAIGAAEQEREVGGGDAGVESQFGDCWTAAAAGEGEGEESQDEEGGGEGCC